MSDATAFTDHQARKRLATRGKSAEEAVKGALTAAQKTYGVLLDWERIPDVRSAGGKVVSGIGKRVGDFSVVLDGRAISIEVKETQQPSKLPGTNFPRDSIARLYVRSLAGARCWVVVHFPNVARKEKWAVAQIGNFFNHEEAKFWPVDWPPFAWYLTADAAIEAVLKIR